MKTGRIASASLAWVLLLTAFGCEFETGIPSKPNVGPGKGVDVACGASSECRVGLTCQVGLNTCQPNPIGVMGAKCTLSAECSPGHFCAPAPPDGPCLAGMGCYGLCRTRAAMPAGENASCQSEGDCQDGLTCNLTGLTGTCVKTGKADLGAPCAALSDCRAGLLCAQGTCKTAAGVTPWTGAMCVDESGLPSKVHFRVPRATDTGDDFFRLPFPNDIRRQNGKIDMKGFPKPGVQLLPFDPIDRYVKAVETDQTGFATNPVVFFRFTRNAGLDSFRLDGATAFVDITPNSPSFGAEISHGWWITSGRGKFICNNYMVMRPPAGIPLAPGHTYAAVIRKKVTDSMGTPLAQDTDFVAMLGETAPAEPELAAAWTAYAPLRAWVKAKAFAADEVVAAAVFTTEMVEDPVRKLRDAVEALPPAMLAVKSLVKCEAGAVSPCPASAAEPERGCPAAADPKFDEYQALVSIPAFQAGTPPFEQEGGRIELDPATMLPKVQRMEDVCVALTVPKGTAPEAGWPLAIYAHGTGGSYRSFIGSGIAADLAAANTKDGKTAGVAVLSYDGVLHGPRKGMSTKKSDELVFNVLNPPAARDNPLQGAADLYALTRAVVTGGFVVPGVKLDPARMALYGHSQGGNAGALAAGYEPRFGAVVLSGTGAYLTNALLEKKAPVNVSAALPLVFGEPVDANHPVLSLFQMYFERSDQVNTAHRIVASPVPMGAPKHLLHVYGLDDTYSPVATQRTFTILAGLPVGLRADSEATFQPAAVTLPATKNLAGVTALQLQVNPMKMYDGHFVSTRDATARSLLNQFIGTFARDGVPVVGPAAP